MIRITSPKKGSAYLSIYAEAECRRIEKIINNKKSPLERKNVNRFFLMDE